MREGLKPLVFVLQTIAGILLHAQRRVAPTLVLKYNIRAVRALWSARSDLAGLDEVVEGGAADELERPLAQQCPDVLLLAVELGFS